MEEDAGALVFQDVAFAMLPGGCGSLDAGELIELVEANGGRYIPLRVPDQSIDRLDDLTHIISTHIDFPQYNAALEHGIHIVKPSWIMQSAKKGKQAGARQHSPDPSQYLQDVVVTMADLPESDKDTIIAGVMAMGGQYSAPLTKLVTHVVATDMNNEKCRTVGARNLNCKIVLPHWFDDCFTLGRKINERPYLLPDPEFLRREHVSKVRDLSSDTLDGATVALPTYVPTSTPPPSPAAARKNLNAFMSKRVFLSKDLQLSSHLHQTLANLINYGGGTLTDEVEDADIYIGQYRDGDAYVAASRAGKEVANLSWLYHVINRNKYTRPLGKLLHYPIPRKGVPGFENMRISISNYTGDARIYVENLIKYTGAEFTKTMKQNNTHLITAHTQSEKCEAAQEWNINIVNHIWLEESYAKCAAQTLSNPRYTRFPARTNLGEVAGQTNFDMKAVELMYFPKPRPSPQKPVLPAESSTVKTKPSPRKTLPSTSATEAGTAANKLETPIAVPDDEETEDDEPTPAPETAKKPRGRPSKSAMATPRFQDEEKENQSPLPQSSGRASKNKAMGMLHQQADDIALFQKEMKRKGGVTHGGRRSSAAEDFSSPAPAPKQRKKRTSDEATYEATAFGSDLSDGETQPVKASKKAKRTSASTDLPPVEHKMMVTGYDRWLGNSFKEGEDRNTLRLLGVLVTQDPNEVDILVAPRIMRTRKFVSALANAPMVVDTSYLDTALNEEKLPQNPSTLDDHDNEERLGFKLVDSLERAKVNDHKLLRGWSIFVTKDVTGGFDTFKDIITLNGGAAMQYAGRTGVQIPKRRLQDDPEAGSESQHQGSAEEFDYVYLVSGLSDAEVKLWKTFRSLAEKQGLNARVVKTDWLLNAAMRQEIEWKEAWLLTEENVVDHRKAQV